MSQQVSQYPHPTVAGIWFHGSGSEMIFNEDRPAFFSCERERVEMFAGREGFILEAELLSVSPCWENHLMEIAAELGLPDVFSEDIPDFLDVSTHLDDPQVRCMLDERGSTGAWGRTAISMPPAYGTPS